MPIDVDNNKPVMTREERARRIKRIVALSRLMDTAFRIPGTSIRFGADSVVGLIPGVGDIGGAVVSLFIIAEARRLGMPTAMLIRMLGNVGLDTGIGAIPLLGDVFDLFFKSNKRNAAIILSHFDGKY